LHRVKHAHTPNDTTLIRLRVLLEVLRLYANISVQLREKRVLKRPRVFDNDTARVKTINALSMLRLLMVGGLSVFDDMRASITQKLQC
jgi:hypothetical protein